MYDQRVVATPTISSDKLSITVEYDKFFPGWAQVSPMPFPAHALVLISSGKLVLPDVAAAEMLKTTFEKSVASYDRASLLAYAKAWSSGYNLTDISKETHPLFLVSNGGYIVESAVANKSVSLVYNEKYNSGPQVQGIARINYRVIADGTAASQALANREIDLLEALPTADGVSSLRNLPNVKVYNYSFPFYEHLDLRVSAANSGGEPYSGIFAGNSAGSAMAGLIQMKDMFKEGDLVVVIFHDHGTRYLGKMFNDDWMRDRGFLEEKSPKAIDLIERHKHLKLVTVDAEDSVAEAFAIMRKFDVSQIPVKSGNDFVGSLSDSHLYALICDNPELKQSKVKEVMQKTFPFVNPQAKLEEVSKQINRENEAVLVRDMLGAVHIITKYDIIEALG